MYKRGMFLVPLALGVSATGFALQIALIRRFGLTADVDGYFYSLSWPVFLSGMVAAAINMRLTPEFRRLIASGSHDMCISSFVLRQVMVKVISLMLLLAGPCVAIQIYMAPDSLLNAAFDLCTIICLAWLFGVLLVALSVVCAVMVAQERPAAASLMNIASPLAGVVAILGFDAISISGVLLSQCVGLVLAIVFSLSIIRVDISLGEGRSGIQLTLQDAVYSILAGLVFTAYPVVDACLANRMPPGGLSALALMQRLMIALSGLVLVAPMAHLATKCTDMYLSVDAKIYKNYASRFALRMLMIFSVFGVILYAIRHLIFDSMAAMGKLSARDYQLLDDLMVWMLVGVVAMMFTNVLHRFIYAAGGRHRYLAGVGVGWVLMYLGLGWVSLSGIEVKPLAMTYSIVWVVCAAMTFWYLTTARWTRICELGG